MSSKSFQPTMCEKYSDLKLVCQGQEFKVHKIIACSQSTVLAAACDGSFQESTTNLIMIEEFDAATVKRLVKFMYEREYDVEIEEGKQGVIENQSGTASTLDLDNKESSARLLESATNVLLLHVKVNSIADYYNVPRLKELANAKIQHILETSWRAEGFSDVIKEVFRGTSDKALHDITSLATATHIKELMELEDFTKLDIMNSFAISIIRNTIAAFKAEEDMTTRKIQDLKSEKMVAEHCLQAKNMDNIVLKSVAEEANKRADRFSESIEKCLITLRGAKACRNRRCSVEFECYIEKGGQMHDPRYTLRCGRCQCRQ